MRAKKTGTEIRQEQILEAALEIIGAEGVSALSIAGIAGRVGIVPSAIYRHFKGKDDLLDALLEHIRSRVLGNVNLAMEEAESSPERLRILLMRHLKMLREIRGFPNILFSDGMYSGHPERKDKVVGIMTAYLEKIQGILREGIQEGSIGRDVDPVTASVMFLGMIVPAGILWNISDGRFDLLPHAEKAWPAFYDFISVKK